MRTGLDRLVSDPSPLRGRQFALLGHAASVTDRMEPAHLALARRGFAPQRLFGPEHGYYGIEQDMVASADDHDDWTGAEIRSLYGESEASLRPKVEAFRGIDLLVVDLQDVGSRYYTYAATGVWAAEVALEAGCEVWILDRPNPLGGAIVEGNVRAPRFESFVGAFEHPARHGLTIGEIVRLELGDRAGLTVWTVDGWRRNMTWPETGRSWVAPSPNMPTYLTALVYPGLCLVEGTNVSEGRGTTRPFFLVGAPGLDPVDLAEELVSAELPGVAFVPTYFRPQFQKHAEQACAGVELVVTDPTSVEAYRLGVEIVRALHRRHRSELWRREAYEFVTDRPAIDLLVGTDLVRERLDQDLGLDDWLESWSTDSDGFLDRRRPALLYPENPR